MKSTDLMIMDWVTYCGVPIQIEQLLPTTGGEAMKAIPLTDEVLEENGIKKCFGNIWYQPHEPLNMTGWYEIGYKDWVCLPVKYVHEVQHLLRLIGFADRADKFTISNS